MSYIKCSGKCKPYPNNNKVNIRLTLLTRALRVTKITPLFSFTDAITKAKPDVKKKKGAVKPLKNVQNWKRKLELSL
jgi:hypothetical protein